MKKLKFYIPAFIIICLVLIVASASQKRSTQIITKPMINDDGFAVLELFTSQGCSSCPPADELLGKYAALNNDHIIPLSFHVDYWNRLGWTDSFSSAKYSQRQRDYAMIIDKSSVYTPQLIINGEKEMVGSDAAKISTVVNNAIKAKPVVNISIDKITKEGNHISLSYKCDKLLTNATMNAALVQKQVFTNIMRGENRGLKLINYNVVRDFNTHHIKDINSTMSLNLPKGYSDKDFQIVLYTQDDASGKITAVTKKEL